MRLMVMIGLTRGFLYAGSPTTSSSRRNMPSNLLQMAVMRWPEFRNPIADCPGTSMLMLEANAV
jgi:hypothetical protein